MLDSVLSYSMYVSNLQCDFLKKCFKCLEPCFKVACIYFQFASNVFKICSVNSNRIELLLLLNMSKIKVLFRKPALIETFHIECHSI